MIYLRLRVDAGECHDHDQQNSISVSFNKKSLCTPEFLSDPAKKGWTKVDLGVEHV